MGVPKFFRYISERYPCLSELVKEYQIPEFDNLYLDMNGIIHVCSHPDDFDPHFRITEEKIFSDIFHYIEVLFRMIKPRKLFFMAVDGVAPRAKCNQQRGRRFCSAKDAEVLEAKALDRGEALPKEARFDSNCITPGTVFMARLQEQLKYFVTNKISNDKMWQNCRIVLSGHETPGEGEHKIMDYIRHMKTQPQYNPNTRHCLYGLDADLIMLGLCTHEPHFSLLREEVRFGKKTKRKSTIEQTTFYLLHLSLMREYLEMEFMPLKKSLPFAYDMEKIIDDWVLMGFLVGNDFIPHLPNLHIVSGALPTLYNAYMKILPTLDGYINEGGTLNLSRFEKFLSALATIDKENFSEHYENLKLFQAKTGQTPIGLNSKHDHHFGNLMDEDLSSSERKPGMNKDLEELIRSTDQLLLEPSTTDTWNANTSVTELISLTEPKTSNDKKVDDIAKDLIGELLNKAVSEVKEEQLIDLSVSDKTSTNTDLLMNALQKSVLTENKSTLLEPSLNNLDDLALGLTDVQEDLDELSPFLSDEYDLYDSENEEFLEAEFLLHKNNYYMNKLDYSNVTPEVMRSQAEGYVRAIQWNLNYYYNGCCSWSWYYPHHYAPYISDIKNFADLKLEYDMGTPFLPFEQLLAVLPAASKTLLPEPFRELMTSEESPIIQYYPTDFKTDLNGKKQEWEAVVLIPFIAENLLLESMKPYSKMLTSEEIQRNSHRPMLVYEYTSEDLGVYNAPQYFPNVVKNHAKVTLVTIEEIRVPQEKLIKGPLPGAITDTYYPGFPTFKHLKYNSRLEKAKVKVFDQPSQNENMIITIDTDVEDLDVAKAAEQLLGNIIYVSWPHLTEALVVGVSDKTCRWSSSLKPGEFVKEPDRGKVGSIFEAIKEGCVSHYKDRLGICTGITKILVHVKTFCGQKYTYNKSGGIAVEKQWTFAESAYPLQAIVRYLNVSVTNKLVFENIQQLFPLGSTVFMLGNLYYGSTGTVIDNTSLPNGRLKVSMREVEEPDLREIKRMEQTIRYLPAGQASQKLAISPHLLSRITGSIFVIHGDKNNTDSKSVSRTNIGLNLKLNKKNEEIPGYTKKVEGQWLYSFKAIDLVRNYMQTFSDIFTHIQINVGNDVFSATELFPDGDSKEKMKEVTEWLKEQPFASVEHQTVGTKCVEPEIVKKIEEIVDKFYAGKISTREYVMQVKPHLLYKPEVQTGYLQPDSKATFELYDRVVNIRDGYTVPFGCRGTIIGIRKSTGKTDRISCDEMEVMYDVVFDEAFAGGLPLNCSAGRGYRMPAPALINLSHGCRSLETKAKVNVNVPIPTVAPSTSWMPPPQARPQPRPPHNSAFVNWNAYPRHQTFAPPFVQGQGQGHMPLRPPGAHLQQQQQQQQQSAAPAQFQAFFHDLQSQMKQQYNQAGPMARQVVPPEKVQYRIQRHVAPQQGATDETEKTQVLKKLLKISEIKTPTPLPNNSFKPETASPQQNSVQDFFARARDQEQRQNGKPTTNFTVQLLNYCQTNSLKIPQFNYMSMPNGKFRSKLSVSDGLVIVGDECNSKQEASENAARKAMSELLRLRNIMMPNGQIAQQQSQPNIPKTVPGDKANNFPSPPKQWFDVKNQQQQAHHSHHQRGKGPFVPLQAVKQQRNRNSSDGENHPRNSAPKHQSQHGGSDKNRTGQGNDKNKGPQENSSKPKPRRPRIAANFSGAPKQ